MTGRWLHLFTDAGGTYWLGKREIAEPFSWASSWGS